MGISESAPVDLLDLVVWVAKTHAQAVEDWFSVRSLSTEHGSVLRYLAQNQGACRRDLAMLSLRSGTDVSKVVDTLESRGLIEQHGVPSGASGRPVHVTDGGEALLGRFEAARAAIAERTLSPLSTEEQQALLGLLGKVTDRLSTPSG